MTEHHDIHEDGSFDHDHAHTHALPRVSSKKLWTAFFINLTFLIIEVIGGLVSNSLALLADAGHMLADVCALALALFVAHLALKPPTPRRTYGLLRAEVFGAFLNGTVLVFIVGVIFWEAIRRIGQSVQIEGPVMLVVAVLGLAANAASAWVLFHDRHKNVNIRGAYLHMMVDTLGSVGAIIAGAVIVLTGWTPIDQIISFFIGSVILVSVVDLISETVHILLEGTPRNIDYNEVRKALESVGHIKDIHDLHIWTISSGIPALSAHVQLYSECSDTRHWQSCLKDVQTMLRDRFGIVHSTLQFEPEDYERDERTI